MDNTQAPDFKELLRSRDLKATQTRLNLLLTLKNHKAAMPYSALRKAMEPIDRVTLYRTLETLKEQGVIHIAVQTGNEAYYAICDHKCQKESHDHDHVHFRCIKCETVTCEEPAGKLEISIPGLEIHKYSVNVEGLCKKCVA